MNSSLTKRLAAWTDLSLWVKSSKASTLLRKCRLQNEGEKQHINQVIRPESSYGAGIWWLQVFVCLYTHSNTSHLILLIQSDVKETPKYTCYKGRSLESHTKSIPVRNTGLWLNRDFYGLDRVSALMRFWGCHICLEKSKTSITFQSRTCPFRVHAPNQEDSSTWASLFVRIHRGPSSETDSEGPEWGPRMSIQGMIPTSL